MSVKEKIYKLFYNLFETMIFGYCIHSLWKIFNSKEVLPGHNYFILPLIIISVALYWQSRQLKSLRANDFFTLITTKSIAPATKFVFFFCLSAGAAFFILGLLAHIIVWSGGAWVNELLIRYTGEFIEPTIPSVFGITIYVVMLLIISIFISGFLFTSFFLGTIFTGASVAIALHNWLNGGTFSIGVFVRAILDLNINDTLSYAIVVGEFIISQLMSKLGIKN